MAGSSDKDRRERSECKADGAQAPRHIERIGEGPSTAQRRNRTAQQVAAPAYAELHCLSNFTFLTGASHPEELVARAAALGYAALAHTDECSLAGVARAHVAAKEHGLPLIVGSQVRLETGERLVLLATDRAGYGNLSDLITRGRRRAEKGAYRLTRDDLEDGLPGCLALLVPQGPEAPEADADAARRLAGAFPDRAWVAVTLLLGPDDPARLAHARRLGEAAGLPLVAAGDVHMHVRARRRLQDLLTAIRLGVSLAAAGHALFPNGERHLRPRPRLARLYPPELLAETVRIAARCRFSLDTLRYEYPEELVPPGTTPAAWLARLTAEGMARRWPDGAPAKVRRLVARELALIADLKYEPYFLTVHEIVRFARSQGILCQGRGSAANSAVCYCLGITEVDPARMEVLFERFISKERGEPPDIDVDFEHERREEVIQHIYARYGRDRAALATTVITYRPRSAVRDVGKALGFSPSQVDRLAGSLAWWDGSAVHPERVAEAGLDPDSPVTARLRQGVDALLGFPRHLSQHVGGFVISRGPLPRLVPIENAAMPERTVIQWDKDDLDALGLLKVDVLALGMLTAIRKALALVGEVTGRPLALADVPAEDPATYAMIAGADTVGVFQIESRAQMAMLPRLKPVTFYDLVIQVAIVRPGPIQGDMVHPYLRRRRGDEPVTYPGPEAEAVLARTLGVPIFQEQVIQLAMVAAGFSGGEADALRRAMAAWRRKGGLEPFERRLVDGMRARGYPEDYARRIFEQIKGFGEYGFPESHAASFALLAYVSAWLKRHHPGPFACALLNSQPMGFYAPAQLIADARRQRVPVRPVAADASGWDCHLEAPDGAAGETGPALRLGLRLVKGLSRAGADRLVAAREGGGPFGTVADLARRAGLGRNDLGALARAGALAPLAGHRRRAHWQALGAADGSPLLPAAADPTPPLVRPTPGEDACADYAATGLTLGPHPLALLRPRLARLGLKRAADLKAVPHGAPARVCGLVIGRQRPGSANGVVFVTLEDETGITNVIVWNDAAERDRGPLLSARLLAVAGTLQREGEVTHLIARRLTDHTPLLGGLAVRSRDFR